MEALRFSNLYYKSTTLKVIRT